MWSHEDCGRLPEPSEASPSGDPREDGILINSCHRRMWLTTEMQLLPELHNTPLSLSLSLSLHPSLPLFASLITIRNTFNTYLSPLPLSERWSPSIYTARTIVAKKNFLPRELVSTKWGSHAGLPQHHKVLAEPKGGGHRLHMTIFYNEVIVK